jgi:hypothetical protein
MDHAGYYGTSSPSVKRSITLFEDLVDRADNIAASAHLVPKRALVLVMQFLGEITASRLAYIRAVDVECEPLARKVHLSALVLKNNPDMAELTHFAGKWWILHYCP